MSELDDVINAAYRLEKASGAPDADNDTDAEQFALGAAAIKFTHRWADSPHFGDPDDPQVRLTRWVLRRLSSELADEDNANYAAELEYCDDEILAAARKLVDDNPVKLSGYPSR